MEEDIWDNDDNDDDDDDDNVVDDDDYNQATREVARFETGGDLR